MPCLVRCESCHVPEDFIYTRGSEEVPLVWHCHCLKCCIANERFCWCVELLHPRVTHSLSGPKAFMPSVVFCNCPHPPPSTLLFIYLFLDRSWLLSPLSDILVRTLLCDSLFCSTINCRHLNTANFLQVEPYYCMSWVLTWFGHDLQDLPAVSRLYDVLLGAHPTLILYICAAVSSALVLNLYAHAISKAVGKTQPLLLGRHVGQL